MGLTIQILLLLMCVWLVVLQPSGPSEPCLTTNDSSPSASSPIIPMSRSEEHTSELQPLMRSSYAVLCLKKKTTSHLTLTTITNHHNTNKQQTILYAYIDHLLN